MSAARKKAARPPEKAARRPGKRRPSDDELCEQLMALAREKGFLGSHAGGLGQLQLWVSAYAEGVLTPDDDPDPGPRGVIAA